MSESKNDYEEIIANLKREKEELEKQVQALNERNSNQAMLLKRLESARQADHNLYEKEIAELKVALSEERIKTRRALMQNNPLYPSGSQRSVMSSPPTTSVSRAQSDGNDRHVSPDDRKTWKDSTGDLASLNSERFGNTAQVQGALLGAAMKKKQRKENKGGFWSLFAPTEEEPEDELSKRNEALLKKNEDDRKSILTKEIMQALEENKRVIEEREQELAAREEVQRVKEEAMRKSHQQLALSSSFGLLNFSGEKDDEEDDVPAPKTPDQVNMNNISKLRDSEMLDVDTLRRLIADRTAGIKEEDLTKTSMVLDLDTKEGSESSYGPEYDEEEELEASTGDWDWLMSRI